MFLKQNFRDIWMIVEVLHSEISQVAVWELGVSMYKTTNTARSKTTIVLARALENNGIFTRVKIVRRINLNTLGLSW